jgi:hypothetical protein
MSLIRFSSPGTNNRVITLLAFGSSWIGTRITCTDMGMHLMVDMELQSAQQNTSICTWIIALVTGTFKWDATLRKRTSDV